MKGELERVLGQGRRQEAQPEFEHDFYDSFNRAQSSLGKSGAGSKEFAAGLRDAIRNGLRLIKRPDEPARPAHAVELDRFFSAGFKIDNDARRNRELVRRKVREVLSKEDYRGWGVTSMPKKRPNIPLYPQTAALTFQKRGPFDPAQAVSGAIRQITAGGKELTARDVNLVVNKISARAGADRWEVRNMVRRELGLPSLVKPVKK